eukprot:6342610-Pyramimonas_sp.AAC.1
MEYPASPSELPPDIFNAACLGDDQPTKIELKGINAIAGKISLRSNRGLLQASVDPDAMLKFLKTQRTSSAALAAVAPQRPQPTRATHRRRVRSLHRRTTRSRWD